MGEEEKKPKSPRRKHVQKGGQGAVGKDEFELELNQEGHPGSSKKNRHYFFLFWAFSTLMHRSRRSERGGR